MTMTSERRYLGEPNSRSVGVIEANGVGGGRGVNCRPSNVAAGHREQVRSIRGYLPAPFYSSGRSIAFFRRFFSSNISIERPVTWILIAKGKRFAGLGPGLVGVQLQNPLLTLWHLRQGETHYVVMGVDDDQQRAIDAFPANAAGLRAPVQQYPYAAVIAVLPLLHTISSPPGWSQLTSLMPRLSPSYSPVKEAIATQ